VDEGRDAHRAGPLAPEALLRPDGTLDGARTGTEREITGDRDADGLSDAEERELGTDPANADTDGDALLDGWEVKGVDGTRLQDLGADPLRRDIFVEMDFMKRAGAALEPSAGVIHVLEILYDQAPVGGPGLKKGIALHLDLDEEVPHQAEITVFSFYLAKRDHFDVAARGRCFHYMIWADGMRNDDGDFISGQSMGIPDDSFVVTLGPWKGDTGGDDTEKVGTFMHELGHNLGLRHGCTENRNRKPNHLSVMSYTWQMTGIKKDTSPFAMTYQWLEIGQLDEKKLNEDQGLGLDPALAGWHTAWFDGAGKPATGPADGPLNWDGDRTTGGVVQVDVNAEDGETVLGKTHNEWERLVYDGGVIGSGLRPARLQEESLAPPTEVHFETLTEQEVDELRAALRWR